MHISFDFDSGQILDLAFILAVWYGVLIKLKDI